MLRMYLLQQCFGLSDEGMKDAVYDTQAIRRFIGIDLNVDTAPDATTLLKFRRLPETHNLAKVMFDTINGHLAAKGLLLNEGTIVDATIIAVPPSTKNNAGERDPEMHQAKKGNEWHFGRKAHIGVDADSGLPHTVMTAAANVNDVARSHALLRGKETHAHHRFLHVHPMTFILALLLSMDLLLLKTVLLNIFLYYMRNYAGTQRFCFIAASMFKKTHIIVSQQHVNQMLLGLSDCYLCQL